MVKWDSVSKSAVDSAQAGPSQVRGFIPRRSRTHSQLLVFQMCVHPGRFCQTLPRPSSTISLKPPKESWRKTELLTSFYR